MCYSSCDACITEWPSLYMKAAAGLLERGWTKAHFVRSVFKREVEKGRQRLVADADMARRCVRILSFLETRQEQARPFHLWHVHRSTVRRAPAEESDWRPSPPSTCPTSIFLFFFVIFFITSATTPRPSNPVSRPRVVNSLRLKCVGHDLRGNLSGNRFTTRSPRDFFAIGTHVHVM